MAPAGKILKIQRLPKKVSQPKWDCFWHFLSEYCKYPTTNIFLSLLEYPPIHPQQTSRSFGQWHRVHQWTPKPSTLCVWKMCPGKVDGPRVRSLKPWICVSPSNILDTRWKGAVPMLRAVSWRVPSPKQIHVFPIGNHNGAFCNVGAGECIHWQVNIHKSVKWHARQYNANTNLYCLLTILSYIFSILSALLHFTMLYYAILWNKRGT